jgi:ATP-binding cassette subfamily B protein
MRTNWQDVAEPARTILMRYWEESAWTIVLVVLIAFSSSIAAVGAPYLFSRLIDQLTDQASLEASLGRFVLYALLLGFSFVSDDLIAYFSFMCAKNLDFIVATSFFDRILKKTVEFFVDHNPAEIQSARIWGEEALKDVSELALVVFIPGVTQITLSLLVLSTTISLDVATIVILYGCAFIGLTWLANKKTRPLLDAAIDATRENAKFVGNAANAMETLRQFGSETWMRQKFSLKAREVRDNWVLFSLRRMGYAGIIGAALAAEFLVTFALLLPRYRSGLLSVGDLVLFNTILLRLNHPFEMIGRAITRLNRAYATFQPFIQIWHQPEERDQPGSNDFILRAGRVAFQGISFCYEGGRGVTDVSFDTRRGAITFLTGETGSGKSTVLKLLLKTLEPQAGRIIVDGVDLCEISRAAWFSVIGVVPQEIMLLNDTLESNIVLGRPLDQAHLHDAAEKAAIRNYIDSLPEGFRTSIGERGLKVSGGERQRIAIARALYSKPKILLLDEASSALDEATETDIMTYIRALSHEVTILAITHRQGVIKPGDSVIRLRNGLVAAPCIEPVS